MLGALVADARGHANRAVDLLAEATTLAAREGIRRPFVVLAGTLSMYLGDPPVRHDVAAGELVHVDPGTPLQAANHSDEDLIVYAYGYPPENERAEILDAAV